MSSSLYGGSGPTGRSSGLTGTGLKQITSPLQNKNQADLSQMLHQLLGGQQGGFAQGLGQLGKIAGGDQSQFEQMERPAMRQFSQLQGNIASRFSGAGSGARRSSGFQNEMSEAATDLAERLQGNRMNFQQQALQQLLGLSESLLGRPTFETSFIPKQIPFWKQLTSQLAGGVGGAAGTFGGLGIGKLAGLIK